MASSACGCTKILDGSTWDNPKSFLLAVKSADRDNEKNDVII